MRILQATQCQVFIFQQLGINIVEFIEINDLEMNARTTLISFEHLSISLPGVFFLQADVSRVDILLVYAELV